MNTIITKAQIKRVRGAESFLATAAPKDRVKVEVVIQQYLELGNQVSPENVA